MRFMMAVLLTVTGSFPDGLPPVLDLAVPLANDADTTTAEHQATAADYNQQYPYIYDPVDGSEPLPLITDWHARMTALPRADSDLIVVGTINTARALPSANGNTAFSEYKVHITETIQGVPRQDIYVVRQGARVKFASGRTLDIDTIQGYGALIPGERYVLFLSSLNGTHFKLITGYRITTAVIPVDAPEKFQAYRGQAPEAFLTLVRSGQ